METTLTQRGQTVIPAKIRKRYNLKKGAKLAWFDNGKAITIIPIPDDIVEALRGSGKGEGLLAKLLDERRKDRERE
ncbi:MAG: AbrB/MazE/SpoVT family DNA-binding domain-containing protein [Chloroflexota bacterium]